MQEGCISIVKLTRPHAEMEDLYLALGPHLDKEPLEEGEANGKCLGMLFVLVARDRRAVFFVAMSSGQYMIKGRGYEININHRLRLFASLYINRT